jgi:hypothetical protein
LKSRIAIAICLATLGMILAGCSGASGPPPVCACPAQSPNMLVAQRGANEVAIYPRQLPGGSPTSTISVPGAESFALVTQTAPTTTGESYIGYPVLFAGEYPSTVAVIDTPYSAVNATITTGISDPAALASAMINGYEALFVANRGANNVAIYESTTFSFTAPTVTISGVSAPDGLAFDPQGNLWVAQTSSVVEFTPPFASTSVPAATITTGLKSPSGIAFDSSGAMYVADKGNNAIVVYPAGSVTPSVTVTSGMNGPGSLLIPGSYLSGDLFVANVTGNSIVEFSLPLTSTSEPFATYTNGMNEPSAIDFLEVSQ